MFQKRKSYFYSSDSKTRNFTLSDYIHIILPYSIFIERFRLKQKKSVLAVGVLAAVPIGKFLYYEPSIGLLIK